MVFLLRPVPAGRRMADGHVRFVLDKADLPGTGAGVDDSGVVAKLLGLELRGLEPRAPAININARVVLAAGLILAAVAAGAGWYGYGKATAKVAFEAFDLSNGKVPPSSHVVMTGVAHTEY